MAPRLGALCLLVILVSPSGAPNPGEADIFRASPLSTVEYGIIGPWQQPDLRQMVPTRDGNEIYVEVHRPDTEAPVPTVLMMTAYATQAGLPADANRHQHTVGWLVPLGYAVAIAHVPGTGFSTGCLDVNSDTEVEATTTVIEWLAKRPWSDGIIGMYGISYAALTQIAVASRGDPDRIAPLKAIVPISGVTNEYDQFAADGVPLYPTQGTYNNILYTGFGTLPAMPPQPRAVMVLGAEKYDCRADAVQAAFDVDTTGRTSAWFLAHESRWNANQVRAAVLSYHGAADLAVYIRHEVGWFDRLPDELPHKAIFAQRPHAFPDDASPPFGWTNARFDWSDIVVAWFNEHLKGLNTQTARWPTVQLEDSEGRWRRVDDFPMTGGRAVQVPLAAAEAVPAGPGIDGTIFRFPDMTKPLHITGMAVADLWVTVDHPSTRVMVYLNAFDGDGKHIRKDIAFGGRAADLIEPMKDGFFQQVEPIAQEGMVHLPVRLNPVDLVVPAGGHIELYVGLVDPYCEFVCMVPGPSSSLTIHHACPNASVLRFEVPPPNTRFLGIPDAEGNIRVPAKASGPQDGDVDVKKVCGAHAALPYDVIRGLA